MTAVGVCCSAGVEPSTYQVLCIEARAKPSPPVVIVLSRHGPLHLSCEPSSRIHIICVPTQGTPTQEEAVRKSCQPMVVCPCSILFKCGSKSRKEAAHTIFKAFHTTGPGFEPPTSQTRSRCLKHYTTEPGKFESSCA